MTLSYSLSKIPHGLEEFLLHFSPLDVWSGWAKARPIKFLWKRHMWHTLVTRQSGNQNSDALRGWLLWMMGAKSDFHHWASSKQFGLLSLQPEFLDFLQDDRSLVLLCPIRVGSNTSSFFLALALARYGSRVISPSILLSTILRARSSITSTRLFSNWWMRWDSSMR